MHHTVVVPLQDAYKYILLNLCRENTHANKKIQRQSLILRRHSQCVTASVIKSLRGHWPTIYFLLLVDKTTGTLHLMAMGIIVTQYPKQTIGN